MINPAKIYEAMKEPLHAQKWIWQIVEKIYVWTLKKRIFAPLFRAELKNSGIMAGIWFEESETHTMRDGAVVARRAHNPKVIGSSPVPAT